MTKPVKDTQPVPDCFPHVHFFHVTMIVSVDSYGLAEPPDIVSMLHESLDCSDITIVDAIEERLTLRSLR